MSVDGLALENTPALILRCSIRDRGRDPRVSPGRLVLGIAVLVSLGTGSLLLAEDSGLHLWDTLSTALLVGAILAPLVIPALISWSERRYSVALYDDRLAIGEREREGDPDPFPKTIAYTDVVELSGTGRGFAMWLCGGRCLCFATDRLQAEDATDFLARRTSVEGGPESASC